MLADGSVFDGEWINIPGAPGMGVGEVVFNTALSGYQEILTDPSYAGQMIAFTYPHIGNYGTNDQDSESPHPWCGGLIVRDLARRASNWRSSASLPEFLERFGIPVISGVDTRRLTRHLREVGAIPGAIGPATAAQEIELLTSAARTAQGTDGIDLVASVTTTEPYAVGDLDAQFRVVAYDYGIKASILHQLVAAGCRVEVVPASTTAADVLARHPDGVFLSNGPGDPKAVSGPGGPGSAGASVEVAKLLGQVPIFGICLGHQILGLALGGQTTKLSYGHHGANHPVRDERTGNVEITSQNHNYAVDPGSMPDGVQITHVNLNDQVVSGLAVPELNVLGVQYHPEAGPGPHEGRHLFGEFTAMMAASANRTKRD